MRDAASLVNRFARDDIAMIIERFGEEPVGRRRRRLGQPADCARRQLAPAIATALVHYREHVQVRAAAAAAAAARPLRVTHHRSRSLARPSLCVARRAALVARCCRRLIDSALVARRSSVSSSRAAGQSRTRRGAAARCARHAGGRAARFSGIGVCAATAAAAAASFENGGKAAF